MQLIGACANTSIVPGKKVQMLTYTSGIGEYEPQIRETLKDWRGFNVVKA